MPSKLSHRPRTVAVPAIAVVATLLCSGSAGAGKGDDYPAPKETAPLTASLGTAKDSTGPAPAIAGACEGGTIHIANPTGYAHLDPQKIYAGETYNTSLLWGRQLTQYQVVDGKPTLVGDLATDTGTSSDGGRTWTYRLKDGIA